MARQDIHEGSTAGGWTADTPDPAVGYTSSGWYAVHACGWVETGFGTDRGARRMLERHIAFVCAAPTCHHP